MRSNLQYEKVRKIVGLLLPVSFFLCHGCHRYQLCCNKAWKADKWAEDTCRNIPLHTDYSNVALISACLCSISVVKSYCASALPYVIFSGGFKNISMHAKIILTQFSLSSLQLQTFGLSAPCRSVEELTTGAAISQALHQMWEQTQTRHWCPKISLF